MLASFRLSVEWIVIMIGLTLAVGFLFLFSSGMLMPAVGQLNDMQAWQRGCTAWKLRGCELEDCNNLKIEGYDPDGDGQPNSVCEACQRALGLSTADECRARCCG